MGTAASGNLTAPGEVLVAVSQTDRFTDVWFVNTDTGALDRNLSDDLLFAQASLPSIRSGGRIVADIAAPDDEFDIYILNLDDGETRKLSNNPDRDTSPSWSPDESRITFRSRVDENSGVYGIGADGSNLTRLTDDPGFDGGLIAFHSSRHSWVTIWLMRADGSEQSDQTWFGPTGYLIFAPAQ